MNRSRAVSYSLLVCCRECLSQHDIEGYEIFKPSLGGLSYRNAIKSKFKSITKALRTFYDRHFFVADGVVFIMGLSAVQVWVIGGVYLETNTLDNIYRNVTPNQSVLMHVKQQPNSPKPKTS